MNNVDDVKVLQHNAHASDVRFQRKSAGASRVLCAAAQPAAGAGEGAAGIADRKMVDPPGVAAVLLAVIGLGLDFPDVSFADSQIINHNVKVGQPIARRGCNVFADCTFECLRQMKPQKLH